MVVHKDNIDKTHVRELFCAYNIHNYSILCDTIFTSQEDEYKEHSRCLVEGTGPMHALAALSGLSGILRNPIPFKRKRCIFNYLVKEDINTSKCCIFKI